MKYLKKFEINSVIIERLEYLRQQKLMLEDKMKAMPEGKLLIAPGSTDNSYRYYLRKSQQDKMGMYIDGTHAELRKIYGEKKYTEVLLKNITKEISQLEKINNMRICDSIVDTYADINPGLKKLITPLNIDDITYVNNWMNTPFERLGFDEQVGTSFYSDRNERMRSKSEVLIANALIKNNIPYKYECPVKRKNGELLFPDFTILDVKNRRELYWEHLGKMGDMSYVARNIWKLDEYKKIGIYLGYNLLITYESEQNALGTDDIMRNINIISSFL